MNFETLSYDSELKRKTPDRTQNNSCIHKNEVPAIDKYTWNATHSPSYIYTCIYIYLINRYVYIICAHTYLENSMNMYEYVCIYMCIL